MTFSCENIKKVDWGSQSDGFLKMFEKQGGDWAEVCKTEMIKKNKDPHF